MKKLKIFTFLISLIFIFNINISYGREDKADSKITNIITVDKDNLLAVIQDNKIEQDQSTVINENNNSTNDGDEHVNLNSYKIQKSDVTKGNTITIPNVCDNAIIMIGSTQQDVNKYDICLMIEAAAEFGDRKPILLGGHNTKSLKYLYNCKINDVITVNYKNQIYEYKVIYSNECITDNINLFDINTNRNMLEYQTNKEILQIYTCYGNNRWFVKAEII